MAILQKRATESHNNVEPILSDAKIHSSIYANCALLHAIKTQYIWSIKSGAQDKLLALHGG